MCDRCVEWNGRAWHRYGDWYYEATIKSHGSKRTAHLHREMWIDAYGPIPEGFDVHHKDHDKGHNELGNFELLSKTDHGSHHYPDSIGRPDVRPKAIAAAVESCRRNAAERLNRDLVCRMCGSVFHSGSVSPTAYCSPACIERARRIVFVPEKRACESCGAEYLATRRVQRYCGKTCNQRETYRRSAAKEVRRLNCEQCGQAFESERSNARFCCRACAVAFHGRHQQRRKLSEAV